MSCLEFAFYPHNLEPLLKNWQENVLRYILSYLKI